MKIPRTNARAATFARDHDQCVVCGASGQDAHHLLERRLWDMGGYDLANLVTLCGDCHIRAEQTLLSVEYLRHCAGIKEVIVPDQLYEDVVYDKWGNPRSDDGMFLRGPLFYDESVQKILKEGGVMDTYSKYVKYPRTFHLPWSHPNRDDKVGIPQYTNELVVVTEKLDGENMTMYNDRIHARSLLSRSHASQDYVKNLWASIAYNIPEDWRICVENLYATHSIHYDDLDGYVYGLSVWERDLCFGWNDTTDILFEYGLPVPAVLFVGPYNELDIHRLTRYTDREGMEGYVIRPHDAFTQNDFHRRVFKYVRANHLQTPKRWDGTFEVNGLSDYPREQKRGAWSW